MKELHYLVFDGTTHYVIPESEFDPEEEELVKKFSDFNMACKLCDNLNEKYCSG